MSFDKETNFNRKSIDQEEFIETHFDRESINHEELIKTDITTTLVENKINIPIGYPNLEIIKSVTEGFKQLLDIKNEELINFKKKRYHSSEKNMIVLMINKNITDLQHKLKLFSQLNDAWDNYNKFRKTVDKLKLGIINKKIRQQIDFLKLKLDRLGRKYNSAANLIRQLNIELLTAENVPNIINSHKAGKPKKCFIETHHFCTGTSVEIIPDDNLICLHKSKRHVCQIDVSLFISSIVSNICKGRLSVMNEKVKRFGSSALIPIEQDNLIIQCQCIYSTGGRCKLMIDPLNKELISQIIKQFDLIDPKNPEEIDTIYKYKHLIDQYTRIKLREKYGSDIWTKCIDSDCQMSIDGFFVKEILERRKYGAPKDEFITGHHVNCPLCNSSWCIICNTEHQHQICRGKYSHDLDLLRQSLYKEHISKYNEEPNHDEFEILFEKETKIFFANYKYCPNCNILSKKEDGCNKVDCANCKICWCFRCGGLRNQTDTHIHKCPPGIEYDVKFDFRSEQE